MTWAREVATTTGTQTLSNKTIDGGSNTFTNIPVNAVANLVVPAAGNPTATIGAQAVNGVSTAFMRADAAPAINISSVLDGAFGSTRGLVLYRGVSSWGALGVGTSGYDLSTQGAGADPKWNLGAAVQTAALTATAPNSTSVFTMGGLAGSFTPRKSGTVMIAMTATIIATSGTINVGATYQLAYGTGTAPAANAALAGTQVGTPQTWTNPVAVTAADVHVPVTLIAVVTGLTINTAYWLDVAQKALTAASGMNLSGPRFSVIEL